jgi:hypothetical protein
MKNTAIIVKLERIPTCQLCYEPMVPWGTEDYVWICVNCDIPKEEYATA